MSQSNRSLYGGQAVIEGVMFAGKTVNVTAVRRKSTQEIEFFEVPKTEIKWLSVLKKIPFLRGLVAIIEASAKGSRHLNFSAEIYAEEEEEEAKDKKSTNSTTESVTSDVTTHSVETDVPAAMTTERIDASKNEDKARPAENTKESSSTLSNVTMIVSAAIVGVLSFIFGKFIFTLIPPTVEQLLFGQAFDSIILHNIIEGIIKLIFLLVYIYLISLTPMIKRLFQYHGAEHKVISAYEANVDLTVENVQRFSTLHYRCGSSFIIFTVIVGVFIYSFFSYDTLWDRLIDRLIMLPVVIGVSYEVLRFTNKFKDTPVLRFLGYPGLWLQRLTTKEPTDDQVEVSIASFQRMLSVDENQTKVETKLVI